MKKRLTLISALLAFAGANVHGQLITDFSSTDLSAWTSTQILEDRALNEGSWLVVDGALHFETTVYNDINQMALTRTDVSLNVGFELQADFTANFNGAQDIGLYVGAGHPPSGVRSDYLNIYVRENGQLFSRGFDGSSELGLSGGGSPVVDALFIARTDTNVFELGWYEAGERNVLATRTMANSDIGNAVGFYADIRNAGTVGSLDNLSIVPEPSTYALLFGAAVLGFVIYRRRRA
jgi:hypothetical protein